MKQGEGLLSFHQPNTCRRCWQNRQRYKIRWHPHFVTFMSTCLIQSLQESTFPLQFNTRDSKIESNHLWKRPSTTRQRLDGNWQYKASSLLLNGRPWHRYISWWFQDNLSISKDTTKINQTLKIPSSLHQNTISAKSLLRADIYSDSGSYWKCPCGWSRLRSNNAWLVVCHFKELLVEH